MTKSRFSKKNLKELALSKKRLVRFFVLIGLIGSVYVLGHYLSSTDTVEGAVIRIEGFKKIIINVTVAVGIALFCVRSIYREIRSLIEDLDQANEESERQANERSRSPNRNRRKLKGVGKSIK
jgi:hypothetical protein